MDWFNRTELLLGNKNIEYLKSAHVLIVGLGGVGAYAAEMLCRAGVGTLSVVDSDVVDITNINRQLIALTNTVGRRKTELVAERLRLINPEIEINIFDSYFNDETKDTILACAKYDYVVDAIDTLSPKITLINCCMQMSLPIVSSMGSGAKLFPGKVEIADISKSYQCPLAHMLRKRLHKLGIYKGFKVVFSPEILVHSAIFPCNQQNKKTITGTISYLPAVFGCFCASVVIADLLGLES